MGANPLKKALNWFAPAADKAEDGRDVWGTRASFILASLGGAVGLGNLLRFPSIAFNNHGLQFFIPYLISLFFLAIPILMLEIALGQAFRGGCVLAWHTANHRAKGVGLSVVYTGFAVLIYYVPLIAWIMTFFRYSFHDPLPWADGNVAEFFHERVIQEVPAIPGRLSDDLSTIEQWKTYPGMGMVPETVGWCLFTWFVVWLCMFKGVGLTGRVVYFTMGLPLVFIIVLLGRSVSLPNAVDGVRLYFAEWHGWKLAQGQIWQEACGQIFFSTGIGMGYFTSFASYNAKFSNAVQDSLIIVFSNSLIEVVAGFSVFAVVGYLGIQPDEQRLNTFVVGFYTYPEAIAQMPAPQFWGILFFATLFILGLSSSFALLEALMTMVIDTDWGKKYSRPVVSTVIVIFSFLLSLIFCTEFGYECLDAADTFISYLALFWAVWCEAACATTLYRFRDVVDQLGVVSFSVNTFGYIAGTVVGLVVAHAVSAEAGAGVGFGLFAVGLVAGVLTAKTPTAPTPGVFGRNKMLAKFWWLSFYSGNQLRRDLNATIAIPGSKNWKIPFFWGPVLKYISAPIVAIIMSFAYPSFYATREDPLRIASFAFMNVVLLISLVGLFMPRWFNVLLPASKVQEGEYPIAPAVVLSRANVEGHLEPVDVERPVHHETVDVSSSQEKVEGHPVSKTE
ncbi:Sodium:neurotransmitter symporter family protein [Sodiomyces alkalinus F11]|uniref:Sodium:neurotransmitter symporter family protein n=1 Tax=Sodiomyces alkalinus (strain CBS 110278 / VKM F-3762 / F11) TaxID=1314773 RepID=A0A3N2PYC1_SODAK|nr:Sodium:neurotransmitter symporter family protein [Sodiomyces alkalinus F11]ROT39510.1 Sodium:neurotransmitter symporter family protein [Sodiomyces alkalinus F11]